MGILNISKNVVSKYIDFLFSLKISLRTKMLIMTAIVFAGFTVVFVLGVLLVGDVKIGSDRYIKIRNYHRALEEIATLKSDFNQVRVEYLTVVEESNPEIRRQGLAAIQSLNNRINRSFYEILQAIPGDLQKPFTDARDEWTVFTDNMSGKIIPLIQDGNIKLALERLQSIQKYRYERVVTSLNAVTETLNDLTNGLEKSTDIYIEKRVATIILSSSLIALVILAIALTITALIVKPLRRAVKFVQEVSSGDLTKELHEPINDEVGALAANINAMVSGLGHLVDKIHYTTLELSGVSHTVSLSSDQVSNETLIQKNSIDRSSAAINEISKKTQSILEDVTNLSASNESTHSSVNEMVESISEIVINTEQLSNMSYNVSKSVSTINNSILTLDNSIDSLNKKTSSASSSLSLFEDTIKEIQNKSLTTLQLAGQASEFAVSGQKAVDSTIVSMNEIRDSIKITDEVITDLSSSADDIGLILSVIEDINYKISLLALNARIISAQSGAAGNSFSVVANEIKTLSNQTALSTLEIVQKIERVQSQTKKAVEAIRKTESVVSQGESLSHISGNALGKIVAVVQQTSLEMDAVTSEIEKQRKSSGQIVAAVNDISITMNQIAKASSELKLENRVILTNSEQMTHMTGNVSRAIKENENAAQYVARASENITLMIDQIKKSCEVETKESRSVLRAMEEITATVERNLTSAQSASHASNILIDHVKFLISAVNQFKRKNNSHY